MQFLVQVLIPCGDTKQLEFSSRSTVDYVKSKIFNSCESLNGETPSHYVLQLVETRETMFVEFLKFLATTGMQDRAERGLPILVEVVLRERVYHASGSRRSGDACSHSTQSLQVPSNFLKSVEDHKIQMESIRASKPSQPIRATSSKYLSRSGGSSTSIGLNESSDFINTLKRESKRFEMQDDEKEEAPTSSTVDSEGEPSETVSDTNASGETTSTKEDENALNFEENMETSSEVDVSAPKGLSAVDLPSDTTIIVESPTTPSRHSFAIRSSPIQRKAPTRLFGSHRTSMSPVKKKKKAVDFSDSQEEVQPQSPSQRKKARNSISLLDQKRRRSSVDVVVFHRQSGVSPTHSIMPSNDRSRFRGLNADLEDQSESWSSSTIQVNKDISLPPVQSTIIDMWVDEKESTVIEPNQFGFHTQAGNEGISIEKFNKELFTIDIPLQENLYKKYFVSNEHDNYVGTVDKIGPIIISIMEEKNRLTRALIRAPAKTSHVCLDHKGSLLFKKVTDKKIRDVLSEISITASRKSFKKIKKADLIANLISFDDSHLVSKFKFGVLYCKEGQTTEDEWFGNEHGSADFDKFLGILGDRIPLLGWTRFRAGLDTKTGATGKESIYIEYEGNEIMFHVSTMLPYDEADEQKIERKRHLGNDIAVVIFLDGDTKFPPSVCKSVFNHTYIVVKPIKEEPDYYTVGVSIKDGVKPFGPGFPFPPRVHSSLLRDFLITKLLNAEWAAYKSLEFAHKFKRTRKQQLSAIIKSQLP